MWKISKCPSSIRHPDSNPWPYNHELSHMTTRPRLPPKHIRLFVNRKILISAKRFWSLYTFNKIKNNFIFNQNLGRLFIFRGKGWSKKSVKFSKNQLFKFDFDFVNFQWAETLLWFCIWCHLRFFHLQWIPCKRISNNSGLSRSNQRRFAAT